MRQPEYYIKELLKEHDCVVIPGFGGFLARYTGAYINPVNNRIYPPARTIGFNRKLNKNDGLLTGKISDGEHISYRKAGEVVERFAQSLASTLSSNKNYHLEGIGTFKVDPENNTFFEPVDQPEIWDEGYGLKPIFSPPVLREEKRKRAYPQKKDRIPYRSGQKVPVMVKLTLAVAVPIILFLVYGILDPSGVKQIPANYSGLVNVERWSGILSTGEDRIEFVDAPTKLQPLLYKTSVQTIIPKLREANELAHFDHHFGIPEIKGPEAKTKLRYYIIGASFTNRDQALEMAEELKYNGFQPALISDPSLSRYRVSYSSFKNKEDALERLAVLREEVNPECWILKR